jgi:protein-tyrosine-phosphatase
MTFFPFHQSCLIRVMSAGMFVVSSVVFAKEARMHSPSISAQSGYDITMTAEQAHDRESFTQQEYDYLVRMDEDGSASDVMMFTNFKDPRLIGKTVEWRIVDMGTHSASIDDLRDMIEMHNRRMTITASENYFGIDLQFVNDVRQEGKEILRIQWFDVATNMPLLDTSGNTLYKDFTIQDGWNP